MCAIEATSVHECMTLAVVAAVRLLVTAKLKITEDDLDCRPTSVRCVEISAEDKDRKS